MNRWTGMALSVAALGFVWLGGVGCANEGMAKRDVVAGPPYLPGAGEGTKADTEKLMRHDVKPLEFLGMLRDQGSGVYVIRGSRRGWVRADDVEPLLALIDDPTPCAAVVSSYSSIYPAGSTVGKEALYLVTG